MHRRHRRALSHGESDPASRESSSPRTWRRRMQMHRRTPLLVLRDELVQALLVRALHLGDLLSVLEEVEGRHGLDALVLRGLAVLVHVDFNNDDVVALGEGVDVRADVLARAAPRGREVHHDELAARVAEGGFELLEGVEVGCLPHTVVAAASDSA
eukprot:CAMPEP_0206004000 /NCGR_PEP_ID=MMETSP1464-20131121/3716_1 /ASSEMBLY_ACC=CAM_ASM_001124 /TAXON_ID=119497 /ORGANISM="Exanthemachrysis gayraliae, Strain RCC1523" /LENGTH=155 /DNA_ID=CAMNT_0053377397 /DNA_START=303 /DNA_END=767 /DNA_ORIENTATION=+